MQRTRKKKTDQNTQKEVRQRTLRKKIPVAYKPPEARGLSDKQQLFCEEYIIDLNGTKAAIRAGYAESTAAAAASKFLNDNIDVRRYIAHLKKERAKRLEVSADRIVEELARIAYADHRTFYDKDGFPISLELLTDDQQAAVKNIKWRYWNEKYDGKPQDPEKIQRVVDHYYFYDRVDALKMLGHHLGMSLDKPSEKVQGPEKQEQEITFEMLLRKLNAKQLEIMTEIMKAAAQTEKKFSEVHPQEFQEPQEDEDHWSNKTINEEPI